MNTSSHYLIDPSKVRDLSGQLLDGQGRLKVVPACVYAQSTRHERAVFGVKNALYGFLTDELIAFLSEFIAGRRALEIGAGHGGLGAALGIVATDNFQQDEPSIKAYYAALGQPTVRYGQHVEKLDAAAALEKYRPEVVLASWVTHRYEASRPEAGGNMFGVKEEDIIAACDAYVFIGNEQVHANKSIWRLPHKKFTPPWLYSRAVNESADLIAIWSKNCEAAAS